MSTTRKAQTALAIGFFLVAAITMDAETMSLEWYALTANSSQCTGNGYTVLGSIGQPLVTVATNRSYTLSGGFWSVVLVQTPGMPKLSLRPIGPQSFEISWTNTVPCIIQSCSDLKTQIWTNVPTAFTNSGLSTVRLPATDKQQFYRLYHIK
jgi:hypothetical protein